MSELEITHRYSKGLSPSGAPPLDAPAWIDDIDNPYLHGVFAPVQAERAGEDLPVEGELPQDLHGAYLRNGPNPRFAPKHRYHWFDGDGMVHGVWFEGGRARYANRYVRPKGFRMEEEAGEAIWPGVLGPFDFSLPLGPLKDTANTDLIFWRGRPLALWYESGRLHALDPLTLETLGVEDAAGALKGRISAHSKVDPATGDFIFFSYGDRPPYMRYGVVRPDGSVHQTDITLPGPRRPHDIGVTPNYSVLHDFPVFFDPEHFKRTNKRVPLFHPDVPTRYGVIPRFGGDGDVRWFEFESCYMYHVVNCWEEGEELVMIGCRASDFTLRPDKRDGRIAAMLSGLRIRASLYQWRMNLVTGATSEGPLDDLNAEFPMIRDDMLGRCSRYSYHQIMPCEIPLTFDGLVKYDLETGSAQRFDYGPGVFGSESPFAPRPGGQDEDEGWVLSLMTDTSTWTSQCWVFDAKHVSDGPVAKVSLPQRVPSGFHATWVPGGALP
ncbi:MAG: carotenoid oxygenase family protein [Alphaproteobacteria bacterium]|nr:carotenoid oxygenase family protein [Alphaproteobacteria bacterium]